MEGNISWVAEVPEFKKNLLKMDRLSFADSLTTGNKNLEKNLLKKQKKILNIKIARKKRMSRSLAEEER